MIVTSWQATVGQSIKAQQSRPQCKQLANTVDTYVYSTLRLWFEPALYGPFIGATDYNERALYGALASNDVDAISTLGGAAFGGIFALRPGAAIPSKDGWRCLWWQTAHSSGADRLVQEHPIFNSREALLGLMGVL